MYSKDTSLSIGTDDNENTHSIPWESGAGFTLIEALVVVTILTTMSSFLILYNRTGERQILLFREQAEIVQVMMRARNLALANFVHDSSRPDVCGYGVYFSGNEYRLYQDLDVGCDSGDHRYSGDSSDEAIPNEVRVLDERVRYKDVTEFDLLFMPPLPTLYFNGREATGDAEVALTDITEDAHATITINHAGNITTY